MASIETDNQFRDRALPYLNDALCDYVIKDLIPIIHGYVSSIEITISPHELDISDEDQKHLVNYMSWSAPLTSGLCYVRGTTIDIKYSIMEKYDFDSFTRTDEGTELQDREESIEEFLEILERSLISQPDLYYSIVTPRLVSSYYNHKYEIRSDDIPFNVNYVYFYNRYEIGYDVIWFVKSQFEDLVEELQYILKVAKDNNVLFHWV